MQLDETKEELQKTITEKNLVIEKLTAKQEILSQLQEECNRLVPFEVRGLSKSFVCKDIQINGIVIVNEMLTGSDIYRSKGLPS